IPLIDVSLVLLVYFMMLIAGITTSPSSAPPVDTPGSVTGVVTSNPELYWVSLQYKQLKGTNDWDKGTLVFGFGKGEKGLQEGQPPDAWEVPNTDAGEKQGLDKLVQMIQAQPGSKLKVNIRADQNMASGIVRDLTRRLEQLAPKVEKKYIGVSEKSS